MEGTAKGNEELKAQGVVEAAQDPNSSVNAADAEKALKDHARAGGAAAFEFNPDASPEEKAAQAKEVQLQPNKSYYEHIADTIDSEQAHGCTESTKLLPW